MTIKIIGCILVIFLAVFPLPVDASYAGHTEEDIVVVFDEEGNYVFSTAMGVSPGDGYIDEDNRQYRIKEVEDGQAIAEYIGVIDLLESLGEERNNFLSILRGQVLFDQRGSIGIYHTHTGESYDTQEPIIEGYGDIYDVGLALAEELEEQGVEVHFSWVNHLPHDGGAYERSRRTALKLLEEGADAIFDVHRDAVPRREDYITDLDGETVSKVRMVVGRQNPNMEANEEFARRLKAAGDELYPGLIKGILFASGNYNQDLSPYAILLEKGSHVTTREEAIASTEPFAQIATQVLFGEEAEETTRSVAFAFLRNLILAVFVIAAVVLGYLFVTEGSWVGVKARLAQFFTVEFREFFQKNRPGSKRK